MFNFWSIKDLSSFFLSLVKLCIGGLRRTAVSLTIYFFPSRKVQLRLLVPFNLSQFMLWLFLCHIFYISQYRWVASKLPLLCESFQVIFVFKPVIDGRYILSTCTLCVPVRKRVIGISRRIWKGGLFLGSACGRNRLFQTYGTTHSTHIHTHTHFRHQINFYIFSSCMTPYYADCQACSGGNETQQRVRALLGPSHAGFLAPRCLISFCVFTISYRRPAEKTKYSRGFGIFNIRPVKGDGIEQLRYNAGSNTKVISRVKLSVLSP
jgi:hypothetical protein